jgi:hypothetical protein
VRLSTKFDEDKFHDLVSTVTLQRKRKEGSSGTDNFKKAISHLSLVRTISFDSVIIKNAATRIIASIEAYRKLITRSLLEHVKKKKLGLHFEHYLLNELNKLSY